MVARMLIDRGQYDKAYEVADEGVASSSPSRVDAAFHAGWIALRFLNDPAAPRRHFAAAAAAAETPISIARANYWRGRAAEALEQNDAAREFYSKAAAYPIAYYGQLAARKLGASELTLRQPVTVGDRRRARRGDAGDRTLSRRRPRRFRRPRRLFRRQDLERRRATGGARRGAARSRRARRPT